MVNEAYRCHLILRDRDQYMFYERCVGKGSMLIMYLWMKRPLLCRQLAITLRTGLIAST